MKLFVHVAVDMFGAECLGKLSSLLEELELPNTEKHRFVWAGGGAPPSGTDFWDEQYPLWADSLAVPYDAARHGSGFETDRDALANEVAQWLSQESAGRSLRLFFVDWPRLEFGNNVPVQSTVLVAGSLADPLGSAIALGFVAGLGQLRAIGSFAASTHLILGIGVESSSIQNLDRQVRALAARGLLDVQHFLETATNRSQAPVWIVGEEKIATASSSRTAQTTIAAALGLAITRSTVSGDSGDTGASTAVNPFLFRMDLDGKLVAGGGFQAQQPVGAAGAYIVHCKGRKLARLLASRVCSEAFAILGRQELYNSIQDCAKLQVPKAIASYLDALDALAIERVWRAAFEREQIPWKVEQAPPVRVPWFELGRLQLLFEPIFESRDWERVIDLYGRSRLSSIPLQDWPGALNDLTEAIEHGVLAARRRRIVAISRHLLVDFLGALNQSVGEVFACAFEEPVHAEPHRVAQALLGRVWTSLGNEESERHRRELITSDAEAEEASARRRADVARDTLEQTLLDVPSPAAVFIRLLPAFLLPVAAAVVAPIDLGLINGLLMRVALGSSVGLMVSYGLFYRHAASTGRRLFGLYTDWLASYRAALDAQDLVLRKRTYGDVLNRMVQCVEWLFSGPNDVAPIPETDDVMLKHQSRPPLPLARDAVRPQEVLSSPKDRLSEAARRFAEIGIHLQSEFQASLVETILPEILPGSSSLLDTEYARLFGRFDGIDPVDRLSALLPRIAERRQHLGLDNALLPFRVLTTDSPESSSPIWTRHFALPTPTELLDASVRLESSGYTFLETVAEYLFDEYVNRLDLVARLQEYQVLHHSATMDGTQLMSRYANLSAPSVSGSNGRRFSYGIAAGPDDPLALACNNVNAHGSGRVSAHVQVVKGLTADSIIFYPNQANPLLPLGLAWKAEMSQPSPLKAFKPAVLL